MPFVPIAAFLAGALLTILLPVAVLIALSVWYWFFSARVPALDRRTGARAGTDRAGDPGASTPGPQVSQDLPHDPAL